MSNPAQEESKTSAAQDMLAALELVIAIRLEHPIDPAQLRARQAVRAAIEKAKSEGVK